MFVGSLLVFAVFALISCGSATGTANINANTTINNYSTGIVAPPMFALVNGTYTSPQKVLITTATDGAQIRYTIDGTAPNETLLNSNGQPSENIGPMLVSFPVRGIIGRTGNRPASCK